MSSDDTRVSGAAGVSRRRWLQLAAAGGVGVLAGCSGQSGDATTTGTTTSTDAGEGSTETTTEETTTTKGFLDRTLRWAITNWTNMTEIELSPYASSTAYLSGFVNAVSGRMSLTTNQLLYFDYEDLSVDFDADELAITLKDDLYWSQHGAGVLGEVTAEDLVLQAELERAMIPESERQEDPAELGYRADGKKTFVVELNGGAGYNDAQLRNRWGANRNVEVYRDGPFGPKLQALKDASSSDEKKQIRTEVTQISQGFESKPLSGSWMVQDVSQQRVAFSLDRDHWVADHINFEEMEFRVAGSAEGSGSAKYLGCKSDDFDAECAIPSTVMDAPDYIKHVISSAGAGFGQGFIVPYASPADPVFWKDPQRAAYTRQAIAFATDKQRIGKNQLDVPEGKKRPPKAKFLDKVHLLQTTGMAKNVLGDLYQKFPSYERDTGKAASRLRAVGFTEDGGTWYKPDGDKFTLEIQTFGWTTKGGQTMADQLRSFGVDASVVKMNNTQMVSKYWGNQDFKATIAESSAHTGPPSTFMDYWWGTGSTALPPGASGREAEWSKYPVPPVGELDAEPTEEVDTQAIVSEFDTTKESELTEDVKKLSWVSAYHLPCLPLWLQPNERGLNTKHFSWPEPEPDYPAKWGNNYGIATAEHHPIYGVRGFADELLMGYGGALGDDLTPLLAKEQ